MGLYYNLPVYKTAYRLLGLIFVQSKDFSREYKYTIGQEMKQEGMTLIKNIYRANKAADKSEAIEAAREKLEMIRLQLRLAQDLGQLGLKKFVEANLVAEDVSKQLTLWKGYANRTKNMKSSGARIVRRQGAGERAKQIQ
jgi:hypothetical protein